MDWFLFVPFFASDMQLFWQIGLHFVFCLYSAGLSFCVVALSLYTFPLGYFLNVGILSTYN